MHGRFRLGNQRRQLPQSRAHQPRLRAHGGIADLAFEFLLGHERRDRIHDDEVQRVGAHQRLADAQGFLTGGGLGNEEFVRVDAEFARVDGVERVLHVDERRQTAALLRLRDERQGEGRLARAFRPENLHDAPARHAADAERAVDEDVARGDDLHVHHLAVAQAHDRPVAVVLGDLLEGEVEFLVALGSDPQQVGGFLVGGDGCSGVFSHNRVWFVVNVILAANAPARQCFRKKKPADRTPIRRFVDGWLAAVYRRPISAGR